MKKLRKWLLERFLPAWAKDSVCRENQALREKLTQREQEIRELNAFLDGVETALRKQRLVIQMGGESS